MKKNAVILTQAEEHSYLPHDLIVEILVLLPVKSLARFRCVCKSWNSLIYQPSFVDAHHRARAVHKSFISVKCFSESCRECQDAATMSKVDFNGEVIDKFSIDALSLGKYCLSNFVHGLTCVQGWDGSYLLNPETRELVMLPTSSNQYANYSSMCLGFSTNTNEYKVVRRFHDKSLDTVVWEILTFGTKEWRSIERPCHPRFALLGTKPVFLHGVLHWTIANSRAQGVLSLDMNKESFEICIASAIPRTANTLVELDQQLCFVGRCREKEVAEIWKLKDYANNVWCKEYTINLRAMDVEPIGYITFMGSQSGQIIMVVCEKCIVCYDTQKQAFTRSRFGPEGVLHLYSESLVSPNYLRGRPRS